MLKAQRDSVISRLSGEDRQDLWRVIAAIKESRRGSPGLTARDLVQGRQLELPENVRAALEAIMVRDESGPRVGEIAPDFSLKRLGSEERVGLSDFRDKWPVALAFGSYT